MRSQNHPIILFIDRFGFGVYQDTLPNIPKFNFTPDLVANLDVINKEQFSGLITVFIQVNKIVPSSLAIILSDTVVYTRELLNTSQKPVLPSQPLSNLPVSIDAIDNEHKEEIQNFLENIPFEEILAKVIKVAQSSRIVAVNKDLVMTIADTFVSKGSVVDAIVPSFMYGPAINFASGLTPENIQIILNGSEIFRISNLLTDQQKVTVPQDMEGEKREKGKIKNLRQYILVGIFISLLLILFVIYLSSTSQKPVISENAKSAANETSIPTIFPTLAQVSVATPADFKKIKIKIVQNSQSGTSISNLKGELIKIGFEDVVIEVSGETVPEKSSIVFSQDVPVEIRNSAIAEIKKVLSDISVMENQDFNSQITIVLGKS